MYPKDAGLGLRTEVIQLDSKQAEVEIFTENVGQGFHRGCIYLW